MYHLKLQQKHQGDLLGTEQEEEEEEYQQQEQQQQIITKSINDALLSTTNSTLPKVIFPTYATRTISHSTAPPPLTSISSTSTTAVSSVSSLSALSSSSSSSSTTTTPPQLIRIGTGAIIGETFGNMTSDLNVIGTVNEQQQQHPYVRHNYAETDMMQHDGDTITTTKLTNICGVAGDGVDGGGTIVMAASMEDKLKLLSAIKSETLLLHNVAGNNDMILKSGIATAPTLNIKNKNRNIRGENNGKYNTLALAENMVTDLSISKVVPTTNSSTDGGIPITTTTATTAAVSTIPTSLSSTSIPMYIDVNDQHLSNISRINLTIESKIMEASTPLSATSINMRPFAGNLVVVSGSDSSDSISNGHNSSMTFDANKRPRLESPKNWLPVSSPGGASSSVPPLSPSTASQSQSFGASMTNEYASPLSAGSYDAFSPGGRTGRDDLSPSSSLNGYATNENCEAKKSKKGPAPRLQEELCLVCGDRASGYHYNALTCEGCKGFFRRSVTKKANYCCKFGHACEMDMYMRRKCQECRLKKCLAVGMRPECVVPENQCAMKRREKKAQKEKDKQQSSPMSNASDIVKKEILDLMTCEPPTHPTFPLLPEDILAKCQARNIPALTHNQLSVIYKLIWYQDGYEQPSEEDLKRIMNSPDEHESQHDMSFRHITEITILTVQLIVEFAKGLPAFTRIPQEDQITLLKACSSEVMMLRMARRYDHSTDSIFFANNRSYNRDTYKMAGVADNIEDLLHFCRQMYAMKVDNVEYALLTAIVIFSDRPGLEEAELVDAIQSYYIDTLRIYILNRHCGDPKTIVFFAKLLSILTELRTLGNQNAEMCFSLKLKNRKLPKFLEEIWDVHTIPPSVQSHIQASVPVKSKSLQHEGHAHAHSHNSSSTSSSNSSSSHGHAQHGLPVLAASTSAEAQQQQQNAMLHNIKLESSPSILPTTMSISSDGSPAALNGSEYSDVSPGLPMMGLVMDQDSMLGGDSGTAA